MLISRILQDYKSRAKVKNSLFKLFTVCCCGSCVIALMAQRKPRAETILRKRNYKKITECMYFVYSNYALFVRRGN